MADPEQPSVDSTNQATLAFVAALVARGDIDGRSAERVLRIHTDTLDGVPGVILKLGLMSESRLASAMGEVLDLDAASAFVLPDSPLPTAALALNPEFLARHEVLFADASEVTAERGAESAAVTLACWDGLDSYSERALAFALDRPVRRVVAQRSEILARLPRQLDEIRSAQAAEPGSGAASTQDVATVSGASDFEDEEIDRLKDLANDAPVIRLVQRVIASAVDRRASDIHFESLRDRLTIRYRLDGLLTEVERHAPAVGAAVISRIKVMANLDIAERRLPQDGRIRTTVQGKDIDFRVATAPSLHGESIVMRILDRQDVALDFATLGYDTHAIDAIRRAIHRPHGIVLVTGPTGSGKTTTLYAALNEINTQDRKLLTVEDPVEYALDGASQVPVKPDIGLTFASALRAFLRQDPDIIMVGEIRDQETAEIAVQAALTGHLLLSTLHTNSAAAAIARLLDMGVEDFLLTSTLHVIVGQRLLRKLCIHCREAYTPDPEVLAPLLEPVPVPDRLYRAPGCTQCQGLGYRGRTTIYEVLEMNDGIRAAVMKRADAQAIQDLAVAGGMRTLFMHGLTRAVAGETTLEEVLRITATG